MQAILDRHVRTILASLGVLFALRITAQWQARNFPDHAPIAFEHYASGLFDYPLLLTLQLLILGAMLAGVARLPAPGFPPRVRRRLRAVAALYFGVMSLRLLIALTPLAAPAWFELPLPAAFHLLLAAYLYFFASARHVTGAK